MAQKFWRNQAPRVARTPSTPPDPVTAPVAPDGGPTPQTVAELQARLARTEAQLAQAHAQLKLSHAQAAYLHRELATAVKQGPLAPQSFPSDEDALRAENRDLRERLTVLTLHHEDLQHRYQLLEHNAKHQRKEIDEILKSLGRGEPGAFQSTFAGDPLDLDHMLTQLLTLAHPDRWAQGQPATALAHEITVALNAAREQLEGRR
jgi:hypothetical protein